MQKIDTFGNTLYTYNNQCSVPRKHTDVLYILLHTIFVYTNIWRQ